MRWPNITFCARQAAKAAGSSEFRLVHVSGRVLDHGEGEVTFGDEAEARRFVQRYLCEPDAWRCMTTSSPAAAA